jgi:hypothetical protein
MHVVITEKQLNVSDPREILRQTPKTDGQEI